MLQSLCFFFAEKNGLHRIVFVFNYFLFAQKPMLAVFVATFCASVINELQRLAIFQFFEFFSG